MPTPSADLPRPPARRRRPDGPRHRKLPGAPPLRTGALFVSPMPITSPNNEQLKEVRKLAGRKWRDKTRAFVAEGEDLIDAAAAAGWEPELLLAEAGSGLPGEEVAPHLLKQVSLIGSG